MSHLFSEAVTPSQDAWAWIEPDPFRNVYGYQFFPPLIGPGVARARFDFVNESVPSITSVKDVSISTRTTGGRTGGWNGDKTKFAVIRTQGSSPGPGIQDFLTYVDATSDDPNVWALAPDIREITTEGGDFAQQIRFVPPNGDSIGRITAASTGRRVLDIVNIGTGAQTRIDYPSFFPAFVGHVRRWAYSLDGQWAAYNLEADTGTNTGLYIFRRSDGALMYHDPVGLNDDISYSLHHFPEDSATFHYMSGTTVKVVSTATWTVVASQAFPSEPRPQWISPGALFYTGGLAGFPSPGGRIWDASFNVVYTSGDGLVFDWNQEGTRVWGAVDARKFTITTPGYVATDVGLVTNEGGYRMRPWL